MKQIGCIVIPALYAMMLFFLVVIVPIALVVASGKPEMIGSVRAVFFGGWIVLVVLGIIEWNKAPE